MTFVKVLGALLVLLMGGSHISFEVSQTNASYPDQGHELILETNKDSLLLSQSSLFAPLSLRKISISLYTTHFFRLSSALREALAQQYIRYSNGMDLSIDVKDLIFPYHTFL